MAESDFERLKALLLASEREALAAHAHRLNEAELRYTDEREALRAHEQRLDEADLRHESLPQALPQLLERAHDEAGEGRLARSLSKPIAQSLGTIVREQRQTVVDALFPVIGPAIRKAIAEYLRGFVDGMNRALEASLTPQGLKWRFESWRTGTPYAMVVLRHTLRFKLDHLFLIERDSGLVLHRRSAPDLPDLDSDAIAGMLTAIGEFVKDSVGREPGAGLESARVGEHVLWLLEGPRANFAAFIRGVPSDALRLALQSRLERIHERLGDPFAKLQAGAAELGPMLDEELELEAIEAEGRAGDGAAAPPKRSHRPFKIAVAVLALLALGWVVRGWWWDSRLGTLREALAAWPGLVVERIDSSPFRSIRIVGLLDPVAEPLEKIASQEPWKNYRFETALRGYVSTDPAIVERRARTLLAPPDGVRVSAAAGRLTLAGTAPEEWIATARERAPYVPGVASVDATALVRAGPSEREQQVAALAELVRRLEAGTVTFVDETEPTAEGRNAVDAMRGELRSAAELSRTLGRSMRVRTVGATDEVGTEGWNQALRGRRAHWLAERLAADGLDVAAASGETAERDVTLRRRAARLAITVEDGPAP